MDYDYRYDHDIEAEAESADESTDLSIPSPRELERTVLSTIGWWKEEYFFCVVALATAAALIALLYLFDGKLQPDWNSDLQFSTVVIFIMTAFRLSLKAVIENCVSQAAWIWVSSFRKGKTEARLEDFKMFDDASRGLWGSIVLLWRMRLSHLACVGAFITILAHGFETFSSQMVQYNEYPTVYINTSDPAAPLPAPPLLRAETWDNVVSTGFGAEMDLGLSSKAAIYDGIMANSITDLPASCATANCTWPIFPSLAVCGNCSESTYSSSCSAQDGCTYQMPSGTAIADPPGTGLQYHFTVAPSNGTYVWLNDSSMAVVSVFDIMWVANLPTQQQQQAPQAATTVQAYECGLWFCLQAYNVTVADGTQYSTAVANWSTTQFAAESSAHFDEYVFVDVPAELNAGGGVRYSVPAEAVQTLRGFMDALMLGNVTDVAGAVAYSSDWTQAMQNATADLPGWVAALALSMTNDVRASGTVARSRAVDYAGTAYVLAAHVDVDWRWLCYPLALLALTLACLAQTVWRTARDQVCAWKGDSLPMLFCRVSRTVHARVRDGMDVPDGLDDRVGRAEVELIRCEDGQWLFREPHR
ncbi:hypothetical protein GGR56DRAFT_547729 [Xylariaceae sp. FL0804]|nr:hypothetical protein GGR56DRAFT_547729 [Xylariaceae sp. FL0804]